MTRTTPILAAAFAALFAFSAAAQQDFSDSKLEAFAMATNQLGTIQQSLAAQLETVEDPQEQQELVAQARTEMAETVERAPGITIEEYNAIVSAANEDDTLAARLNEMLMSN